MSPVSTGSSSALTVDYRYIFTDALTDSVLAELPLTDVSFTNKLNEAGSFQGSFPITPNTSVVDVYNNTVPGKTSLYVLRDGKCVWGGLISQRSYDIKEKRLEISADDFISYLDRRVVWKTWSTEYEADIEIFEDPDDENRVIGKATLTGANTHTDFALVAGISKVWISFRDDPVNNKLNYAQYSGQYTVLNDTEFGIDPNKKFFHFAGFYRPASSRNFKRMGVGNISSELVSVRFRMETDDYLNTLLTQHFSDDLLDLGFENEYVAPSLFSRYDVVSYSRTNNVATVTTSDENYFVPGQIVAIRDLPGFSTSRTRVTSVGADNKTFSYNFTGANLATTPATLITRTITHFQRTEDPTTKRSVVTITTATDHGFDVGDIVRITNLDNRIDANIDYYITRIGTSSGTNPRVFQFENSGPVIRFSKAGSNARATKLPIVEALTAGSFIENSNLNITFAKPDVKTAQAYQDPVRGAELFTFKEIIDKYATDLIGFDYRIECSFDAALNKFTKQFKFLPLVPDSLNAAITSAPGGVLPETKLPEIEYFSVEGRDARNISFEFPGNIESVGFSETIEEGATRLFVQGKTDVDAPPPYAGAADIDFLKGKGQDGRRWPLFDKVIKKDKMFYANDLYEVSKKVLAQAQMPVATISIAVNGTLTPTINDYRPGDWCVIRIDDPFIEQRLASYYENKGDTTRNVLLRKISSVSVQLSTNPALPERVTLELVTEPGVDITGAERSWR